MDIQENFARQTIELARQARLAGNHPFGAVLVVDGKVVFDGAEHGNNGLRSDRSRGNESGVQGNQAALA
jgi:tRNA(Arg) A34 adenosine deaminase TadA